MKRSAVILLILSAVVAACAETPTGIGPDAAGPVMNGGGFGSGNRTDAPADSVSTTGGGTGLEADGSAVLEDAEAESRNGGGFGSGS